LTYSANRRSAQRSTSPRDLLAHLGEKLVVLVNALVQRSQVFRNRSHRAVDMPHDPERASDRHCASAENRSD
jgi:hypothetical protein